MRGCAIGWRVGERASLVWRCSARLPSAARRSRTRRRRAGSAEKMVAESYPGMPDSLTRRAVQDRSQEICSKIGHAKLTQEEAAEVVRLARDSIKYPASGKLVGDWKVGARLAYDGQGERIVRRQGRNGQGERRALPQLPRARPRRDQRRQRRPEPDRLRRAARQLGGGREAHLREDLQRVGLLPVLQHAAPRSERPSHARADRPPRRVSDRSAVSGEPQVIQPVVAARSICMHVIASQFVKP